MTPKKGRRHTDGQYSAAGRNGDDADLAMLLRGFHAMTAAQARGLSFHPGPAAAPGGGG